MLVQMNKIIRLAAVGAAVAATCAYADATVYEAAPRVYSPYLTTTETVIWENRNLADIVSFSCMVKGGWIGTASVGSGVIYDRTATSCKVQFQTRNGGLKMVRAYFRQDGANIVARADKAGLGNEADFRRRQPDTLFDKALATTDSSGTYGAYNIEAFGDTTWTVDAIPANEDGVVVSNGTLQVNVSADTAVATAISGNGALRFVGNGQPVESTHVFDQYVTTSDQTLVENADVFDIEVVSAVFAGSWRERDENALPYNVTSNLETKTMTVQIQDQFGRWNNIYGLIIRLAQSGDNVVVRGISTRQADRSKGETLGSDMAGWTGSTASIATSAEAGGYGLESITFVKRAVPQVVLTGTKGWTGGTVADGCFVRIKDSQLADLTDARAMNGGTISLSAYGVFDVLTRNRYRVEDGSTLRYCGTFAVNRRDAIDIDGGVFVQEHVNSNIYANDMTLANGATLCGINAIQTGYEVDTTWRTEGNEEIHVGVPVRLVKRASNANPTFTIDAAADIVFEKDLAELGNYQGMKLAKQGAAKATFAEGCVITGMVTLVEGSVRIGAASSVGPLVLSGNVTVEVDDGATLAFDNSAGQSWAPGAVLDFVGTFGSTVKTVRFGTDATGLTGEQLKQITMNGVGCRIDAEGYLHPKFSGLIIEIR